MDKYTFYKRDENGVLTTVEFEPTEGGALIHSASGTDFVGHRAARKAYRQLVADGYELFDGAAEELRHEA